MQRKCLPSSYEFDLSVAMQTPGLAEWNSPLPPSYRAGLVQTTSDEKFFVVTQPLGEFTGQSMRITLGGLVKSNASGWSDQMQMNGQVHTIPQLESMGVSTGIDLEKLLSISQRCEQVLGRELHSRIAPSGLNPLLSQVDAK
jgi:hypothetical protein